MILTTRNPMIHRGFVSNLYAGMAVIGTASMLSSFYDTESVEK